MRLLFLFLFLFSGNVFAQISVTGDFDVTNFPEVSVTINNRDLATTSENSIKLIQNIDLKKVKVDSFKLEQLVDTNDYSKSNKCVIILIEALQHIDRKEQYLTFSKSLIESFSEIVNDGDKIQLYAFSLRTSNTKILRKINLDFTDNISVLQNSLKSYVVERGNYTKYPSSEIYGSILEAIDVLNDFETTLPKSILLLSEERNNLYSTQKTSDNAIEKALRHNISINTVKYNRSNYLQHKDPTLADQTYGTSYVLKFSSGDSQKVNATKLDESAEKIKLIFSNLVKFSKGKDYKLSFISKDFLKDGKAHNTLLYVNNFSESIPLNYRHPGNWIYKSFQQYLLISILVSLCILLLLIFLLKKLYDSYNEKIRNENERIENQEKINLEQENKIKDQDAKFNELKIKEENKIKQQKELEVEQKRVKDEESLIKAMLSRGKFPILRYSCDDTTKTFEINHPNILVGRDKSCFIFIDNSHLSRKHFSIEFINNSYILNDNNSANGLLCNGIKLDKTVLKNGDTIEIANMKFIFYT
tara:strand:+ start:172 stop:1761 length:1590 start_codon:yes stop_codon:yes gene_type:complete